MIGLITPKRKGEKKYIFAGKWINNLNRSEWRYFKFTDVANETSQDIDLDNMGGQYSTVIWETRSRIPFKPDDIVLFRGTKYVVLTIEESTDTEPAKEGAFRWFKENGNIVKTLRMRSV